MGVGVDLVLLCGSLTTNRGTLDDYKHVHKISVDSSLRLVLISYSPSQICGYDIGRHRDLNLSYHI